ncbi:MAG: CPBP family intramembrane metalloprotease [Solobacterium sp.]|nr:CPBP family intramembrane metalloprotease [Solobacterium sp.]
MRKNKFNISVAMTMLLYSTILIALTTFNIRLYSVISKSDDLALTRFYGSKAMMVTVVVVTAFFLLLTPLKINLKSLRPSKEIFIKQMKPSALISAFVLLLFIGFRFYMQSKDPSIAEIPYFGLYLNMNTRWFYPVSIVLQEIFIKAVVQDNFSDAFERKHIHMTVWVTALFFFIIHFQYPLYYMTGAMVLCMITGYLYEKYPSIWGPVLIHFVIGFLPRCLGILQIIER